MQNCNHFLIKNKCLSIWNLPSTVSTLRCLCDITVTCGRVSSAKILVFYLSEGTQKAAYYEVLTYTLQGSGSQTFCRCGPISLQPKLLRTPSFCQRFFDHWEITFGSWTPKGLRSSWTPGWEYLFQRNQFKLWPKCAQTSKYLVSHGP